MLRAALGDAKLTYLGFSYGSFSGRHLRQSLPDPRARHGPRRRPRPRPADLHRDRSAIRISRRPAAGVLRGLHRVRLPLASRRQPHRGLRGSGRPGARRPVAGPGHLPSGRAGRRALGGRRGPLLAGHLAPAGASPRGGQPGRRDRTSSPSTTSTSAARATAPTATPSEANAAVNCLDTPALSLGAIQAEAPLTEKDAPVFGLLDLYGEAQCSVWPVPATGTIGPIRAAGSPPIVVVGSTGDPVTPYGWAQSLARQLARGVLLTRVGDGHTAYGSSACIRTQVDRYLISLTVPPGGHPLPQRLSAKLGADDNDDRRDHRPDPGPLCCRRPRPGARRADRAALVRPGRLHDHRRGRGGVLPHHHGGGGGGRAGVPAITAVRLFLVAPAPDWPVAPPRPARCHRW